MGMQTMTRLRVIAGTAKGRRLNLVPGDITRPITDRVKESLFNILRADLPGSVFLDLFAGTGSVGIEALSRGAKLVRFVDKNKPAIDTIRENIRLTRFEERCEVLQIDAYNMLARNPDMQFDYVYIAPPQYNDIWKQALLKIDAAPNWMVDDGWAIVQIHPKEYEAVDLVNLSEFDQRKYGNTLLVFYERV